MGITVRDRRPGESANEYVKLLKQLEAHLKNYLRLGLHGAQEAIAKDDHEELRKTLFGADPPADRHEMTEKIVKELNNLSGELAKRIHKAAPPGSPTESAANALLVQSISIQAAAKLLAQSLNRPVANLVQSLQGEVNQEMAKGAAFDAALETAKETISRRVITGVA